MLRGIIEDQEHDVTTERQRSIELSVQLADAKEMVDHCMSSFYDKTEDNIDSIRDYIMANYEAVSKETAQLIAQAVSRDSYAYGVPIELMVAMMEQESGFNPQAIGRAGERGLMQIHPKWWKDFLGLTNIRDLHDINYGIECGARVLQQLLGETKGNLKATLKKYNGGNLYPSQIYEKMGKYLTFRQMKAYENSTTKEVEVKSPKYILKDTGRSAVLDNANVHGTASDSRTHSLSYVVVAGDTYGSIANKFYGDVNKWHKIADANPYPETAIPIGVQLVIP